MIRILFTGFGLLVTTILLIASTFMNWRYGFSLGRTEVDGLIYGAAAASADGLKALSPFFALWALRRHAWLPMIIATLIWLLCSIFSFTSAIGFAALNRADTFASRAYNQQQYQNLQSKIDDLTQKLSQLPKHRPIATLQSEITAHQQHFRWQTTDKCTNATVTPSRTYCKTYFSLQSELATAEKSEQIQKKLVDLQAEQRQLPDTAANMDGNSHGDPHSHCATFSRRPPRTRTVLWYIVCPALYSGTSIHPVARVVYSALTCKQLLKATFVSHT